MQLIGDDPDDYDGFNSECAGAEQNITGWGSEAPQASVVLHNNHNNTELAFTMFAMGNNEWARRTKHYSNFFMQRLRTVQSK